MYFIKTKECISFSPRILQTIRQNCFLYFTVFYKPEAQPVDLFLCISATPTSRRQRSTSFHLLINGNSVRLPTEATTTEIEISFYFLPTYSPCESSGCPRAHTSPPETGIIPQMAHSTTASTRPRNSHTVLTASNIGISFTYQKLLK
jgi:hypothetical protein